MTQNVIEIIDDILAKLEYLESIQAIADHENFIISAYLDDIKYKYKDKEEIRLNEN